MNKMPPTKLKPKEGCTTCAEQCADHGGGLPFNDGCLCNDGELKNCKNTESKKDK